MPLVGERGQEGGRGWRRSCRRSRAPCAVGGDQPLEQVEIDLVIAKPAQRFPLRDRRPRRRSAPSSRASIVAGSPSASIASCARAQAMQIVFRPGLAQPQAERRDVVDQLLVAARLGIARASAASVRRASSASRPALDRPEARARSRLRPETTQAASARSCGWSGSAGRRPARRAPRRTGAAPARASAGS